MTLTWPWISLHVSTQQYQYQRKNHLETLWDHLQQPSYGDHTQNQLANKHEGVAFSCEEVTTKGTLVVLVVLVARGGVLLVVIPGQSPHQQHKGQE